jgi:hypothetical protein
VQPARHPGAGLVEVGHRGSREQVANRGREFVQAGRALGHHPSERPGRHRRPEHVGQQPGGPVDRQVLVDQQIAAERAYPRAVLGRRAHLLGKRPGGHLPAGAAAPLTPMLDDPQAKRGQVEDLADLDPGHRPARKLATAATAPVGNMDHDLVRVGDLHQVRAWGARLLTRPAPATIATRGTCGLGQAVRGRRLGGV